MRCRHCCVQQLLPLAGMAATPEPLLLKPLHAALCTLIGLLGWEMTLLVRHQGVHTSALLKKEKSSWCEVLGFVLTVSCFEKMSLAIAIPSPLLFFSLKIGSRLVIFLNQLSCFRILYFQVHSQSTKNTLKFAPVSPCSAEFLACSWVGLAGMVSMLGCCDEGGCRPGSCVSVPGTSLYHSTV